MQERYIASPSDLIHKQKEEITQIKKQLSEIDQAINNDQTELNDVVAKLPFLKNEITQLENELPSLQKTTSTLRSSLDVLDTELSKTLALIDENEQKTSDLERAKGNLQNQHSKVMQVWLHGSNLLQDKASLYLAKIASKQSDIGKGMDIIEFEMNPRAETQLRSIEDQLKSTDDDISALQNERATIDANAFALISHKAQSIRQINSDIHDLKNQKKEITTKINEQVMLKKIAGEDSLHGFAVRGETPSINQLLSANTTDAYGKKPLYYALRCGHVDLFINLMDFTKLTNAEEKELIAILPTQDKNAYSRLFSALANKNTYDHLWDNKLSLGDNIKNIFRDYFSPVSLKQFDFLSDSGKRILTLNWNRNYIDLAKDIVTLFSVLEPKLKEDQTLCQMLIDGKWDSFFKNNPDPNDPFARRLYYVKNKMEPHQSKKEVHNASVAKLGFLANSKERNAIEMQYMPEKKVAIKGPGQ